MYLPDFAILLEGHVSLTNLQNMEIFLFAIRSRNLYQARPDLAFRVN
jgi:hypothetical protein